MGERGHALTQFGPYPCSGTEKTNSAWDVKEGVYFGRDVSPAEGQTSHPIVGPNLYPVEQDLPGFEELVKSYSSKMVKVG